MGPIKMVSRNLKPTNQNSFNGDNKRLTNSRDFCYSVEIEFLGNALEQTKIVF